MNEWEWQLLEDRTAVSSVPHDGGELKPGTRVRLRPHPGGDVLDLVLAGKTAVIEAIEQDYEGVVHLALVFDEDPGRDLGMLRQPGHRFFYGPGEVEICAEDEVGPIETQAAISSVTLPQSILIAGIGNIFLADDGFGVEVARRLSARELPVGVRVVDYGIRGLDLAYALMEGADVTILVDACPRGEVPGTLYIIEPDLAAADDQQAALDPHAMNPLAVIRMAQSMGGELKRILLVGCEPATLGPEEGQLGLSEVVENAVDGAVDRVLTLVGQLRDGGWPADRDSASLRKEI